ncbi:MAG: YggT family protein [Candidatus Competibacteraceae bacterium]|nr:YggT family protein [Candidatus Competibacteraceae bacterium]MBK7984310.1 YggT family protein [Candidatus Competibacteraceae bacterium]MBK8896277.1 YggT family protein [Candidatus Competibacteraceae bacterium]MBK8964913.1 YggT family protein [Candidatus Competibacteraceae bacterium]MBK9950194.1 YggT family protein [Candidatus Competibacteraceae bacterium]
MTATIFLIQTLFGFYILAVMLRFLLQCVRADFYNPLVQFLVRITNPLLVPLRRIVPGYRGWDLASIVLAFTLQLVEIAVVTLLLGRDANIGGLMLLTVMELLKLLINIYLWGVVIQAVLSWFSPDPYHPAARVLAQLTAPLLRPARRLLPPISGVDLSPMVVIVALIFISLLLQDFLGFWLGAR